MLKKNDKVRLIYSPKMGIVTEVAVRSNNRLIVRVDWDGGDPNTGQWFNEVELVKIQ